MEKPPITENLPKFRATDAEIQAVIKARHLDERDVPLAEQRMTAMTIILINGVAEAQRDADAAYYEPLIQQAKDLATLAEYHRLTIKHSEMMAEQVEGWRKRVEEARAEVVREIFEAIEMMYPELRTVYWNGKAWQGFKAEHIR